MKNKDENKPVIVYSGSASDAMMIKSYIESAGIKAFVIDELSGTLAPFTTSPGGVGAVKVVVAQRDFDEAKIIIDDFFNNLNS